MGREYRYNRAGRGWPTAKGGVHTGPRRELFDNVLGETLLNRSQCGHRRTIVWDDSFWGRGIRHVFSRGIECARHAGAGGNENPFAPSACQAGSPVRQPVIGDRRSAPHFGTMNSRRNSRLRKAHRITPPDCGAAPFFPKAASPSRAAGPCLRHGAAGRPTARRPSSPAGRSPRRAAPVRPPPIASGSPPRRIGARLSSPGPRRRRRAVRWRGSA